jgi:hypothetical protein
LTYFARAPKEMEMIACKGNHSVNVIHDPRGFDWVTFDGEFCFDCESFYRDCVCNPKKVSKELAN